jgi:hypothetical protein
MRYTLVALLAVFLYTAIDANAQQIAVWNEVTKTYVAVKAGANIKVDLTAKTISAVIPPAPKPRVFGQVLTFTTDGWLVPFGAVPSSIVITVNGLRYTLGIDYLVTAGMITAIDPSMMSSDSLVVVDFDQQ